MALLFKRIVESDRFHGFITLVILFAGILVGLETYPELVARYGVVLHALDQIVLWIFVAEVVIKMGAHGRRPWLYFADGWNVFDFVIVAACFLPVGTQYVTVLRLARLLRVLRLVHALPKLQILVGALLKSIPSMAYVSLLLFLLFYVYGVAGVFLFGKNDPMHFGNLQTSMLSLFRVVTLEDWTDVMYIQMYGCDHYGLYGGDPSVCTAPKPMPFVGASFFVTFVLFGTMIILNLFIGVIMSGMEEASTEAKHQKEIKEDREDPPDALDTELELLQEELLRVQEHVGRLARRAGREIAVAPDPAASPEGLPVPAE